MNVSSKLCLFQGCSIGGIVVGLQFIITGIFLLLQHENLLESSETLDSNTKMTVDMFKQPKEKSFLKFYFFNLTNPDEVTEHGAKPIFNEIGPYSYRIVRERENIHFLDNGDRVWFEQRTWYYFNREKSIGSDLDTFTSVDLVAYKAVKSANDVGAASLIREILVTMKRDKPFKRYTIRDLLFGHHDELLKEASEKVGVKLPHSNFGLFIVRTSGKSRNGSVNENFVLDTDQEHSDNYQNVLQYNGLDNFNQVWPNVSQQLRGRLGYNFASKITTESKLELFSGETCSYQTFQYSDQFVQDGMLKFRFEMDLDDWRDSTGNLNKAMCDNKNSADDPIKCGQKGVLNVKTCKKNSWFMSLPHFYSADPYYLNLVEGLQPNEEKHQSIIEIYPSNGLVSKLTRRFQINVPFYQMSDIPNYENLPKFTMIPITWFEMDSEIHQQIRESFHSTVHKSFLKLGITCHIVLAIGFFIFLISICAFFCSKRYCGPSPTGNRALGLPKVKHEMAPLKTHF